MSRRRVNKTRSLRGGKTLRKGGKRMSKRISRRTRRVSKRGGRRIKRRSVRRTRSLRKGSKKNGRRMRGGNPNLGEKCLPSSAKYSGFECIKNPNYKADGVSVMYVWGHIPDATPPNHNNDLISQEDFEDLKRKYPTIFITNTLSKIDPHSGLPLNNTRNIFNDDEKIGAFKIRKATSGYGLEILFGIPQHTEQLIGIKIASQKPQSFTNETGKTGKKVETRVKGWGGVNTETYSRFSYRKNFFAPIKYDSITKTYSVVITLSSINTPVEGISLIQLVDNLNNITPDSAGKAKHEAGVLHVADHIAPIDTR